MASLARTVRTRVIRALVEAAPRNLLVRRGAARSGRVALTFDDGPCEMTTEYLDALDALGIRATFFLVGEACRSRPEDVLACVARGHEVASHGFTHTPFPDLGNAELRRELEACDAALPLTPRARPLLRPPRGACTVRTIAACAAQGYTTVLWSIDSDDCRTRDHELVAQRVDGVRAGDVVLLHEGQQWTLDALPRIAERLRVLDLEPVTVSELLGGAP